MQQNSQLVEDTFNRMFYGTSTGPLGVEWGTTDVVETTAFQSNIANSPQVFTNNADK
jgi:hypothetical protein